MGDQKTHKSTVLGQSPLYPSHTDYKCVCSVDGRKALFGAKSIPPCLAFTIASAIPTTVSGSRYAVATINPAFLLAAATDLSHDTAWDTIADIATRGSDV